MLTVFVSDLHLSDEAPEKVDLFLALLDCAAAEQAALYLLGDIFEIWLGDDDDSDPHPRIREGLRRFTGTGAKLYVMRGNRDFLLGERFAAETGAELLTDWHLVEVCGEQTLLTHGDLLCTRDVQYQQFRAYVRDPANQAAFLANPLVRRREIAAHTRSGTKASMLEKMMSLWM